VALRRPGVHFPLEVPIQAQNRRSHFQGGRGAEKERERKRQCWRRSQAICL